MVSKTIWPYYNHRKKVLRVYNRTHYAYVCVYCLFRFITHSARGQFVYDIRKKGDVVLEYFFFNKVKSWFVPFSEVFCASHTVKD
jgi:hypothetical protein